MLMNEPFKLRDIHEQDVQGGMALSFAEGWNQTPKDWHFLINTPGHIGAVTTYNDKIIGTTLATTYGDCLAWIGMVLVDRDFRGLGISKAMLEYVIERVHAVQSMKLDATAAGHPVYQGLGFREECMIIRMVYNPNQVPDVFVEDYQVIHALSTMDLSQIIQIDHHTIGANRSNLLEYLMSTYPSKAWTLKRNDSVEGFALGRDGIRFHHIGPVNAINTADAKALITVALQALKGMPVVIDVLANKKELVTWLHETGFNDQRPFTRMYKKNNLLPESEDRLFAISGPEFG